MSSEIDLAHIKALGKQKNKKNLNILIELYQNPSVLLELKREVVSSIGRQSDKRAVASFIANNFKSPKNSMDMIYQFYRTCLKNDADVQFQELAGAIEAYYANEVIQKMKAFHHFKKEGGRFIETAADILEPTLLVGDCEHTLRAIKPESVKLVFTSPPYYNAREYSVFRSYEDYLIKMKAVLEQCHIVLETGRFLIINVSPVISKRPGREFESIRYPIHFDFHRILVETGFEFIDEIIWLKNEYSVPNRNGAYSKSQRPLGYKPNCVTESIMVYRKKAPFLLDKNIAAYSGFEPVLADSFERTNCWKIEPKSSKHHPAIFPSALCERILHYYSFPNDLVLDPFGGSGTLGEMAKKMGRTPLLCEMHDKYAKAIEAKGYRILA